MKRTWITYGILLLLAAAIVLAVFGFEFGSREIRGNEQLCCLSDGCFTVCVLYIGCGILLFIQEAGNFYGISFLFHTVLRRFSPGKGEEKQTYFAYCQEKKERRAAEGKSVLKSALLQLGLFFLGLSMVFTALFYR